METNQKIEAVLSLIKGLEFSEAEKKILLQTISGDNFDILEIMKQQNEYWKEAYNNLCNSLTRIINTVPNQYPIAVAVIEPEKNALSASEDSSKIEVQTKNSEVENRNENSLDVMYREEDDQTKRQPLDDAAVTPAPKRRGRPRKKPLESVDLKNDEKNLQKGTEGQTNKVAPTVSATFGFELLYEKKTNPKAMIRSKELIPNEKILGVVIPYKNKKTCFGVSFYEEKKKLLFGEAVRKAKTMPKYHGYHWQVMDEKHRESILVVLENLNNLLDVQHGDHFWGSYLLSPPRSGQSYSKVRYTVELDD